MNEKNIESVLAARIEYTVLLANTQKKHIDKLCREASRYDFYSVVVPPIFIKRAKHNLKDRGIKICSTIGFPLGNSLSNSKSYEAQSILLENPDELELVINLSLVLDNETLDSKKEIRNIVALTQRKDVHLKAVIEYSLLNEAYKIRATQLVVESGINSIVTSTGFAKRGTNVEDILLLRENFNDKIKIKAAGGIRTVESALALIKAGADTIGTSAGADIMNEANQISKVRKKAKSF